MMLSVILALLLLFQGFDTALEAAIPRKLYEYMITNRPILGFAPPGEIPNLIEDYNCGICLSGPEPDKIIEFMNREFERWRSMEQEEEVVSLREMPDLVAEVQIDKLIKLFQKIGSGV